MWGGDLLVCGVRARNACRRRGVPAFAGQPLKVLFAPLVHGVKDGLEALAAGSQRVFDLRRYLTINLPAKDTLGLELPQLLSERPGRYAAQGAVKVAEALVTGHGF